MEEKGLYLKKWEKYVLCRDCVAEEEIKKIYQTERNTLKTVSDTLFFDAGKHWEKETEKVSIGALWRCCTCIESMLLLLRESSKLIQLMPELEKSHMMSVFRDYKWIIPEK